MSQSRRERRNLERKLGLRKKNTNLFSPEEREMREKRKKAGEEIHRQNLENQRNGNYGVYGGSSGNAEEYIEDSKVSLKSPEIDINLNDLGLLNREDSRSTI